MPPREEVVPRLSSSFQPALTVGEAGIGQAAYMGADTALLAERLFEHFSANSDDMGLLLDLSVALQLARRREDGLTAQREALARRRVYRVCGSQGPPREPCLHLLALVAPGDLMTNTPLEFIVAHIPVRLDLLYVLEDRPLPDEIPDHDVAFIAVSQSDDREALIRRLARMAPSWPRPIVQDPRGILRTSRERVFAALHDIEGVAVAPIYRANRAHLDSVAQGAALAGGLHFPVLVRPVDSHAGKGLEKIADAAGMLSYLLSIPDSEFYVTQYIDYAGPDGRFRKYRITLVDGSPHLCHMAISERWMVHYANAGMVESETKRAEEAREMAQFDERFARRHAGAFRKIYERIGLEYLGIDCGETPDGDLLVFEADAAMVIHAMDPPEIFPYKRRHMQKVFNAVYDMLERRTRISRGLRAGR